MNTLNFSILNKTHRLENFVLRFFRFHVDGLVSGLEGWVGNGNSMSITLPRSSCFETKMSQVLQSLQNFVKQRSIWIILNR